MPDSGVHFHGKHPDRPPKGTSLATVGFYAARAAYAGAPWPNLSAITSRVLSFHDGPAVSIMPTETTRSNCPVTEMGLKTK
jgi:hypothetical protein